MINVSRQWILAAVVASLTLVGSVSNAAPGKSNGVGGWEPSADQRENVVISIKTDPTTDAEAIEEKRESAEPVCVALQIGINLLMDTVDVGGNYIPVTPTDNVVLFAAIGGVELINTANDLTAPFCLSPTETGPGYKSLEQLLQGFVNLGGEIVVWPLCAISRGITPELPATMDSAEDIHNLFLYADKVIDFWLILLCSEIIAVAFMVAVYYGLAFKAAKDLVLQGAETANGYSEDLLHQYRTR